MANKRFSEDSGMSLSDQPIRKVTSKPASAPSREKPAFPGVGLPGKTQGGDRSGGMGRKARVHPRSQGL